jgi:hypothetical protein
MNIFVGIIITKYNREREFAGKYFMLSDEQKKWVHNRIMIISSSPKMQMKCPLEEWRVPFYYIAKNNFFSNFILTCIILNTIMMCLVWPG